MTQKQISKPCSPAPQDGSSMDYGNYIDPVTNPAPQDVAGLIAEHAEIKRARDSGDAADIDDWALRSAAALAALAKERDEACEMYVEAGQYLCKEIERAEQAERELTLYKEKYGPSYSS